MRMTLVTALLFLIILVSGSAFYIWYQVQKPFRGYAGEIVVEISPGLSTREIVDRLVEEGVLSGRYTALAYLYFSDYRGRLQAGEFLFDEALAPISVFEKLARGEVRLYTFTVPEGFRVDQIADRWEQVGFGDSEGFLRATEAALPAVREINPQAVSIEGYLFPETYSFPAGVTADEAVAAMVRGLEDALGRLASELEPERWPLDLNGMLILASLIESEAAVADERALVSSVFLNRLERGMRLECDPTVIYALIQDGQYRGRLLRQDLSYDSPYNTYVYGDLPPGPITNPGYLSMLAAVQPSETEYLFFVRTDGGRHTFSRSLAEHNRAVAAYRASR
jgi:UPF0755 protein